MNIKKLFPLMITLLLIITLATIPTIENKKTLRTNFELEEITSMDMNKIYLLDKNNYFVQAEVFIGKLSLQDEIERIIDYLKEKNTTEQWIGYVPDDVKLLNVENIDNILYLNFSEELKKIKKDNISGLIHTLLSLDNVDKISIKVEDEYYDKELYDDTYHINTEYNLSSRKEVNEIVIYYINNIDENYYVPVTKYINSDKDKIEIIVEELKNNIPNNLVSYLRSDVTLKNYDIENDMMVMNFNKNLIMDKDVEKFNLNTIAYSVFANYNVSAVSFQIDGKHYKLIEK